jgi:hypothetical protein
MIQQAVDTVKTAGCYCQVKGVHWLRGNGIRHKIKHLAQEAAGTKCRGVVKRVISFGPEFCAAIATYLCPSGNEEVRQACFDVFQRKKQRGTTGGTFLNFLVHVKALVE